MAEEIVGLIEAVLNSELFKACSWLVIGCCIVAALLAFAAIIIALITILGITHNVPDKKGWNRLN